MFKKLLLGFLILTSSSFAMTQSQIVSEMSSKIDKVLLILKDSNTPKNTKGEKIIGLMNPVFDYDLMSRLSLGRTWSIISTEQKVIFTKLFTKKLKDSYVEKLDLYSDEIVKILGIEKPKSNRLVLKTQLVGKSENYDIIYKFYQKSKESWLIYDVDLVGVSIIQTYRQQFAGFLKDKSFDELLTYLKTNKTK